MQVKYLVGARNVRIIRRKGTEVLRMGGREVQHKLFLVESLAILGIPSMLLEVFRNSMFAFVSFFSVGCAKRHRDVSDDVPMTSL